MTLNLEFDWEDKKNHQNGMETHRTLSLSEGVEMQDTIGGHGGVVDRTSPLARNKVVQRAIPSTSLGNSSVSDSDSEGGVLEGERIPLVKI